MCCFLWRCNRRAKSGAAFRDNIAGQRRIPAEILSTDSCRPHQIENGQEGYTDIHRPTFHLISHNNTGLIDGNKQRFPHREVCADIRANNFIGAILDPAKDRIRVDGSVAPFRQELHMIIPEKLKRVRPRLEAQAGVAHQQRALAMGRDKSISNRIGRER